MRGLGRVLWQKKTMIMGVTLLAAGAAFLVVNAITPRFRSESRMLLEVRENAFFRADADKTADRTTIDPEAVASQIQVVLSRDLALKVIQKTGLGRQSRVRFGGRRVPGTFSACSASGAIRRR